MKKLFGLIFVLFVFSMVVIYRVEIHEFIMDNFIHKKEILTPTTNNYTLNYSYNYVKTTDNFIATDKQHLLDIMYTYLNSGEDNFYFYCGYDNCSKDINKLTDENIFININNFIHPYNTYNKLFISANSWGKVNVQIAKTYNKNEIARINEEINSIMNKIITDNMTDKEKIKAFHNYIINNTKYDIEYIENDLSDLNHPSHKASGPLFYFKSLCGGYAHVMSVFLNKLKIPNYRISSETHIWNLVYIDNDWYHLDLTWDDPVTTDKSDLLLDKFFLISTKKLESFNTGIHNFDKNIYMEVNQTN